MPECKKCGSSFEIPKFSIEILQTVVCPDCIKIALIEQAKLPIKEQIEIIAKDLLK